MFCQGCILPVQTPSCAAEPRTTTACSVFELSIKEAALSRPRDEWDPTGHLIYRGDSYRSVLINCFLLFKSDYNVPHVLIFRNHRCLL